MMFFFIDVSSTIMLRQQYFRCRTRDFRCNYGACIKRLRSCDGKPHCADSSDETSIACLSKKCRSTEFKCQYGACIREVIQQVQQKMCNDRSVGQQSCGTLESVVVCKTQKWVTSWKGGKIQGILE